jgi:CheY-like chemotaxis protein
MDGLEATRRIRNATGQATDAAVPIVGMTAHSTNEDRESFAAYGVTEVIEKPVAEPELLARLESYAEGNR